MYSSQKSSVSSSFELESLEPRIMLSGDTGVVAANVSQVVIIQDDFGTLESYNKNEQDLTVFYDPGTDFSSNFDTDRNVQEDAPEDNKENVSVESEVTSEVVTENELLKGKEVAVDDRLFILLQWPQVQDVRLAFRQGLGITSTFHRQGINRHADSQLIRITLRDQA